MIRKNIRRFGWMKALCGNEAGQALVEVAISLPILGVLIIGAAEFAQVAYTSIEVSNAAKAGVEYGSQNGGTAGDTTGIALAASNDAANLTGLVTTSAFTCICSDGSASTCANTDCSNSHIEEIVTVNTSLTYKPLVHWPGFPTSFPLKGQAIEKCAQ